MSEQRKDALQEFNDWRFCWRHPVSYDVDEGCPLCNREAEEDTPDPPEPF